MEDACCSRQRAERNRGNSYPRAAAAGDTTGTRSRERIGEGSTRRRTEGRTDDGSFTFVRARGGQATKRAATGVRSAVNPARPRPHHRGRLHPVVLSAAARAGTGAGHWRVQAPSGQGHEAARVSGSGRPCQIDRPSRHLMVVTPQRPHLTGCRVLPVLLQSFCLRPPVCWCLVVTGTGTGFTVSSDKETLKRVSHQNGVYCLHCPCV